MNMGLISVIVSLWGEANATEGSVKQNVRKAIAAIAIKRLIIIAIWSPGIIFLA